MKVTVENHGGPSKTGKAMHKSASFISDMRSYSKIPFEKFFEIVKRMKYQANNEVFPNGEFIARPKYAFEYGKGDCKQKAVLIAAWCNSQSPKVPYKFIASSERPDRKLHHVFPVVKLDGKWVVADPTYDLYFLGQGKNLTYWETI